MSEQEQTLENNQSEDLEAKIIARAWKSEAYKQELLENPKAVIAREFDVELPAEVNVQVLEETPTNLYFILPMRPEFEDVDAEDISEEELEAIAGGSWIKAAGKVAGLFSKYVGGKVARNKSVQYTATAVSAASISGIAGGAGRR